MSSTKGRIILIRHYHPLFLFCSGIFIASLQFRLVIVLASDREPLTSEQSAAIQTLPSGLPSSPPTHLQGVALDANRISISWDPPLYPNGPLVSYSLTIQEASSNRNVESYQVGLTSFHYYCLSSCLSPLISPTISTHEENYVDGRQLLSTNRRQLVVMVSIVTISTTLF